MATTKANSGLRALGAHTVAGKISFLMVSAFVFIGTYGFLDTFDLLPNVVQATIPLPTGLVTGSQTIVQGEYPSQITIPRLNLTAVVANPTSTNAEVLDRDLLLGAVRYPSSGLLGASGANVVMFGHSSYLPVVRNQAFKTFDGIQTLKAGDQIVITGSTRVFVYRVETVASANAQKDGIPLSVTGNKLTLVTCDSFATKSDRFVVSADLVESYPLAK